MSKNEIVLLPAIETDFLAIVSLARSLDLDCEDLTWKSFVIAKKNDTIVGIGRLKYYPGCAEIATVGVRAEEQKAGLGTRIVKELISKAPNEVFVTCVIPDFFNKMGFRLVKQYPSVLQKKVDFCRSYNYTEEQIFVMKFLK